ncbi:4Fe-4S binding protein [Methanosphaera cuniculi]|uniref:4Fe-4S binding protein n=1 Tax=Methanosphaera cuniculi TaxID=1077256 RepID=UPI0026EE4730|nr:4Fe-4S binding protein [Methanosphaera cuniculi]
MMVVYEVTDACNGCPHGLCLDVCPTNAIKIGSPYVIDTEKCICCSECMDICPANAIIAVE